MKKLILLLGFVMMVFGCIVQEGNQLTVVMSLGEEEWQVFRQEIFPQFEERFGVKVKAHQIEANRLLTKLMAFKLAGLSEIDVFAQDNMSLAALVNKDLAADLSEYESQIPKAVLPNLIDAGRFNGKLMFMPFRPNVQIVYYNRLAFKKYNLDPPQNWGQLYNVAKRFYDEEGRGRFVFKAFGGNPTATQIYEFVLQAGGDPYAFNDAGCQKAFAFLQKLKPYFSIESGRAKWDTVNEMLARREATLGANWPFGVVILVKNYGLDFMATYSGWAGPAGERHVIGGDVFGIPKNSSRQELAVQFILFMQSKEVQERLTARLGWPSIREDAYAQVEPWQQPHFESVRTALKHGVFRKNVTWWPAYKRYVNLAFREIVMKGAPVQPTLDKYKEQLENEKKRYE